MQAPQQYLKKPMFQVQEQLPQGSSYNLTSAGWNLRGLNTVTEDDGIGAVLNGDHTITLPAGEYEIIVSDLQRYLATGGGSAKITNSAGDVLLHCNVGTLSHTSASGSYSSAHGMMVGRITLASEDTIKLEQYVANVSGTTELGVASNVAGLVEIYATMTIWALSQVVQAPIVYNQPVQPITGAYVTGNIFGGELEYETDSTFLVKPVSCMSDDLTTALAIDATTQVAIGSPVADTVYNCFLVRYDTAALGYEIDTDVNGANLPANVTHKRWLGFVRANASAAITPFFMDEDTFYFTDLNDSAFGVPNLPTDYTQYDLTSIAPPGRTDWMAVLGLKQTENVQGNISMDGVNDHFRYGSNDNPSDLYRSGQDTGNEHPVAGLA